MLSYRWRPTTKWERINFMLNSRREERSDFFSQHFKPIFQLIKLRFQTLQYSKPHTGRIFLPHFFYIDLPFMNQERRFIYFIFILFFISAFEYNLPFPIFQRYPRQIKMQAFPSAYNIFFFLCLCVLTSEGTAFLFQKSFSIFSCFEFTRLIRQMYI